MGKSKPDDQGPCTRAINIAGLKSIPNGLGDGEIMDLFKEGFKKCSIKPRADIIIGTTPTRVHWIISGGTWNFTVYIAKKIVTSKEIENRDSHTV